MVQYENRHMCNSRMVQREGGQKNVRTISIITSHRIENVCRAKTYIIIVDVNDCIHIYNSFFPKVKERTFT